jgi:hypothetical protein
VIFAVAGELAFLHAAAPRWRGSAGIALAVGGLALYVIAQGRTALR